MRKVPWVHCFPVVLAAMTTTSVVRAAETDARDMQDVKDSKDHPRVSRFKGTAITRYQAEAFGQIATNRTAEGRAKNRRVELVEH